MSKKTAKPMIHPASITTSTRRVYLRQVRGAKDWLHHQLVYADGKAVPGVKRVTVCTDTAPTGKRNSGKVTVEFHLGHSEVGLWSGEGRGQLK